MAKNINGSVTGDWATWEGTTLRDSNSGRVSSNGEEVVNTFLKHFREMGVHATEVMLRGLGNSPANHHKYKCPKVAKYAATHTMSVVLGHLEEAKRVYAEELRRHEELARRQKLAADTVSQATDEAVRKAKNAKRNAKKRAARRRIKYENMKTEMQNKLELAQLKRSAIADLMKKGMQHTVEGRKTLTGLSAQATQATLEGAELAEKMSKAMDAEVHRKLPHMVSTIVPNEPEIVEESTSSDDEDYEFVAPLSMLNRGSFQTMPAQASLDSLERRTVPVTVHGSHGGTSRTQKKNAMKKLKKLKEALA